MIPTPSMTDLQPLVSNLPAGQPVVIAGPCSAESHAQIMETARAVRDAGVRIFRAGVWKPRTMPGCFEGVGSVGLEWLTDVREQTGLLTATEVATRSHVVEAIRNNVDILWIGARTTTNPFAMQELADAIAEADRDIAVLVKNPVNPDLELWIGALQRIYNAGVRRLGAIHRGFSIYGADTYRNPPIWRIALELKRRIPGLPIITDPSHIGGKAALVAPLARQAMDMGFDGLIIETHPNPDKALSDSEQQLTPAMLAGLLETLPAGSKNVTSESLASMRAEIDRVDNELLDVLGRRMEIARQIAVFKKEHGMPIVQPDRYQQIVTGCATNAEKLGMDPEFAKNLMASIHEESVRQQLAIYNPSDRHDSETGETAIN